MLGCHTSSLDSEVMAKGPYWNLAVKEGIGPDSAAMTSDTRWFGLSRCRRQTNTEIGHWTLMTEFEMLGLGLSCKFMDPKPTLPAKFSNRVWGVGFKQTLSIIGNGNAPDFVYKTMQREREREREWELNNL